MDELYNIIDSLNKFWNKDLGYLYKALGLSKSTFYRRLNELKKNGLKIGYIVNLPRSKLKIVNAILSPTTVSSHSLYEILLSSIRDKVLGPINVMYAFMPYRKIILSFIVKSSGLNQVISIIYRHSRFIYDVDDILILDQYEIPIIIYSESRIIDPLIDFDPYSGEPIDLDIYDHYIVDGLLHGLTSIKDIAETYVIPESIVRYHYRSHVKEVLVRKIYYIDRKPNYMIQLSLANKSVLYRLLNELYSLGVITNVDSILYTPSATMFLALTLLRVEDVSKLIQVFNKSIELSEDIYDIRLFPIYREALVREGYIM